MSTVVVLALVYGFTVIAFCLWLAGLKPTQETRKLFPKNEK